MYHVLYDKERGATAHGNTLPEARRAPSRRYFCFAVASSGRQQTFVGAPSVRSAGGAGDVGGHDVGGMTIKRNARPVVAHGGWWGGVGYGLLDVAQRTPASRAAVFSSRSGRRRSRDGVGALWVSGLGSASCW